MKKETVGQRGKTAEKLAQEHLDSLNARFISFAYERLPDARAAGGRFKATISDYLCWYNGRSVPLEVKSTEHDYRLPKDALAQLPRLHKVSKAGAHPHVLVLFKGLEKWRIAPADFFVFGVPSWDMRDLPLFDSVRDALNSTDVFPVL